MVGTHVPFTPKDPVEPEFYVDREELLDSFRKNIRIASKSRYTKPSNLAILGDWGVGKTSTLLKFNDILLNELKGDVNAFSVMFSVKPTHCRDLEYFAGSLLTQMTEDYRSTRAILPKLAETIAQLRKEWRVEEFMLGGPQPSGGVRVARREPPRVDLTKALMELWGKLNKQGMEVVVIMIDDIHYVASYGWKSSVYDLRTIIQELGMKGAKFMFVITGPASLYEREADLAEPFRRLFDPYTIGNFDERSTKEAILKPLRVTGADLTVSDEVVRRIHRITRGHPYFIKFIMRELALHKERGKIDGMAFSAAYPRILGKLASAKFKADIANISELERKVLNGVARKEIFYPKDMRIKGGRMGLKRLEEKGLVRRLARGEYELYHPLFREYLLVKNG